MVKKSRLTVDTIYTTMHACKVCCHGTVSYNSKIRIRYFFNSRDDDFYSFFPLKYARSKHKESRQWSCRRSVRGGPRYDACEGWTSRHPRLWWWCVHKTNLDSAAFSNERINKWLNERMNECNDNTHVRNMYAQHISQSNDVDMHASMHAHASQKPCVRGTTTGICEENASSTVLPSVSNSLADTCTSAEA